MSEYILREPVVGYVVDDGDGLLIPMLDDTYYYEDKELFVSVVEAKAKLKEQLQEILHLDAQIIHGEFCYKDWGECPCEENLNGTINEILGLVYGEDK